MTSVDAYRLGAVDIASGSTSVRGVLTGWRHQAYAGDAFKGPRVEGAACSGQATGRWMGRLLTADR